MARVFGWLKAGFIFNKELINNSCLLQFMLPAGPHKDS